MDWYVGVLLTVNGCHYYVPISSAKPKHQRMSNSLDFHKLQDADTGYLYAVLNLNNMIPGSSLAARCCNFKLVKRW